MDVDPDLEAVRERLCELRIPRAPDASGSPPRPEVHWPILITFGAPVEAARCVAAFDDAWRERHDAVLHALGRDGEWAPADPDAEQPYHAAQVALRLPGDAEPRSSERLTELLTDVAERAEKLGALLTEPRYPLESAVQRAADLGRLRDLIEERDEGCVQVRVVDAASGPAPVLERVGFDERRGGLYVWSNHAGCVGADPIIGARLDDGTGLSLWFAVPRVADPFAVLDAIVAVAALVVRDAGGRIVDDSGNRLDSLALRAGVADIVERMEAAHLVPGDTALSLV